MYAKVLHGANFRYEHASTSENSIAISYLKKKTEIKQFSFSHGIQKNGI